MLLTLQRAGSVDLESAVAVPVATTALPALPRSSLDANCNVVDEIEQVNAAITAAYGDSR